MDVQNLFGRPEFMELWEEYFASPQQSIGYGLQAKRLASIRIVEPIGANAADYTELPLNSKMIEIRDKILELLSYGYADLIIFPKVVDNTEMMRLLEELTRANEVLVHRGFYDVAPFVSLDGKWEEYYGQKDRKFRYNLRRAERKLNEIGRLEIIHYSRPQDIYEHLPWAFELYAKRARKSFRRSLWLKERGRAFLRDLAVRFAERGWMDLAFLTVGGQPIAFCYGFQVYETYYFYATGFDPDKKYAQYSPGILLIKHLIERAFSMGFKRFDFMLGDEAYKRIWATHARKVFTYVLGGRNLRSRLAFVSYTFGLSVRQRMRKARFRKMAEQVLLLLRS